jgi:hypothetical protein
LTFALERRTSTFAFLLPAIEKRFVPSFSIRGFSLRFLPCLPFLVRLTGLSVASEILPEHFC